MTVVIYSPSKLVAGKEKQGLFEVGIKRNMTIGLGWMPGRASGGCGIKLWTLPRPVWCKYRPTYRESWKVGGVKGDH